MPSMQPEFQDVHIDQLLSFLSVAYMNLPSSYIADQIFPIIGVRKQSDKYAIYTKNDWFRDEAELRSPGTESQGSGWTLQTPGTYSADNFAVHKDVPDEIRENADAPYSLDIEAVRFVVDRLKLRREISWATDHFTTGKWGTDATPANLWSDYALSDPVSDFETGRDAIHSVTAVDPNVFVIGRQVWTQLKHHPDFLERIKYTQRAILTTDLVAAVLEIGRIMIGAAIKATNKEGATAAYSYIFGKHGLLAYVAPNPALLTPSAGYTFHWNRFGAISYIRRLRDDFKQFDRVEGHTYYDQVLVASDVGYFFNGAVA